MDSIKTSSPISVSKRFEIPVDELWTLISTPGNLNECHPFCKSNEVLEWTDESHIDRLVYLNDRTYVRRFLTWDEGQGYTLRIGEDDGLLSFVEWTIRSLSETTSELNIRVHPYLLAGIPKIISYLPYKFWVRPKLHKYLTSVVSGFEHVARTKEPVPRNHFGRHSWFS